MAGHALAVGLFHPLIPKIILPRELLSSPNVRQIIGEDVVKEIKTRRSTDEQKVLAVLDLIDHNDSPNKWEILTEVFSNCDFAFVPKILLKEYDPGIQCQLKKIIGVLKDENIDTEKLSQTLKSNDLLTDQDVQDINTEYFNRDCRNAALLVLIDRIDKVSLESWQRKFLDCLVEDGYNDAVKKINREIHGDAVNGSIPDMEIISVTIDDHWRKFVMELIHGLIIKTVPPSGLLGNLRSLFDPDEKKAIRFIANNKSEQDAMEQLLDTLDKKDSPDKWRLFKKALELDDYEWIADFIEGKFVDSGNSEIWKHVVNVCEKELGQKINPREILPHLRQKKLINDKDSQAIEQMQKNNGDTEAVFLLLTFLPNHQPNTWYPDFMEILCDIGLEEAVLEMDPDIHMDIQKRRGHKAICQNSCPTDESRMTESLGGNSDVKEAFVSISGDAQISRNNLSCPKDTNYDDLSDLHASTVQDIYTSYDENNIGQEHETSEKIPVSSIDQRARVKATNVPVNSGHEEPDSLMLEAVQRELAILVSPNPTEIVHNIVSTPYDDVDSDSDSDDEDIEFKELNLRNYQTELAEPALQGKNCIIVAPTGCGKTFVALQIMKDHFVKMKEKGFITKIVFLVEQGALARQQAKQCKDHLVPNRVKLITGEISRDERLVKPLSSWLKRRDLLVVTSQLLVNALKSGDVKITDFTMLMFDECHHANANHSYAQIMHYYMDCKMDQNFNREKLPKVVGMTASVGVGRSNQLTGPKDHIKQTMANLDAEELVTVQKNKVELSEFVIIPQQDTIRTPPREKDYFGQALVSLMENTERYMINSTYADRLQNKEEMLKAPTDKGSDSYTQWISRLRRDTARINDHEALRYLTTCRNYLNMYNQALIIYEDARVKDAMNFLEEELANLNDGINKDSTDDKMLSMFEKSKKLLNSCVNNPFHINPKLEALKNTIFKMCKENKESRIIVFIKTRDLAQAIVNWMKETEGLDRLKPVKFVGTQAPDGKGGMTKKDQNDILNLFREGGCQIINATSVAEEGLDIQTCNLVIRYDHVTNEIAMVQSRGRGRMEGCKFIVIASEKRGTAEKEEINKMKEETMNQVIEEIQREILRRKEAFLQELEEMQKAAKQKRDLEALSRRENVNHNELVLRCGKCSHFICMSSDIRKIQDAHHVVVSDDIRNHVTVIKANGKYIDANITVNAGRFKCLHCGTGLGQIIIHKGAQFPIAKVDNFVLTDSQGKRSFYKKWKSVPFKPEGLSDEHLEARLQGQPYVYE